MKIRYPRLDAPFFVGLVLALMLGAGVAMLNGCVAPPAPQTPRQMLLASYGLAESLANDVADLRASKSITPEQANDASDKLREARGYLKTARMALAAPNGDTSALVQAKQLLLDLQL